eukprot:g17551.t1
MQSRPLGELAASWMPLQGVSDEEEDSADEQASRPARLGLGAKFLPHAAAASAMDEKIKRRLTAPPRGRPGAETEGAGEKESEAEEDEEGESRTGSVKRRKAAPVSQAAFLAEQANTNNEQKTAETKQGHDDVPKEKRKRKKTRSKQKGIRRDTRPELQRPNYRIALPKPKDGKNRPNNWIFANLTVDPRVRKLKPSAPTKEDIPQQNEEAGGKSGEEGKEKQEQGRSGNTLKGRGGQALPGKKRKQPEEAKSSTSQENSRAESATQGRTVSQTGAAASSQHKKRKKHTKKKRTCHVPGIGSHPP